MFGLDSILNKALEVIKPVAEMAIQAAIVDAFPPAALFPGVTNMVADQLFDLGSKMLKQNLQQGGVPGFQINDILDMFKKATDAVKQPCDPEVRDHCNDKYSDITQKMIDDKLNDFLDMWKKAQTDKAKDGKNCGGTGGAGGKGGVGGKGGTNGTNGTDGGDDGSADIRTIALALASLETTEAKNLKKKTDAAADSLGIATSGKPEDAQKDADIRKNQFQAQEEAKAEGVIMTVTSNTCASVFDSFKNALNAASQAR